MYPLWPDTRAAARRGRRRQFCNAACKMRHARGQVAPVRPTFPALPAWHHGRFEAYAQDYAGLVDVIITDPPYGKDNLPCYEALATFAATVLTPGAGSSPWWVTSSALRWSAAGMPWAGGSMCTSSRIGC